MKIKFKIEGNDFLIDARKCESLFSKIRGLMFRKLKNSENLIFLFNKKTNISIHSFFVFYNFIAIWFDGNKIVDVKLIRPWKIYVKPIKKFDKILEIPLKNQKMIDLIVGNRNL